MAINWDNTDSSVSASTYFTFAAIMTIGALSALVLLVSPSKVWIVYGFSCVWRTSICLPCVRFVCEFLSAPMASLRLYACIYSIGYTQMRTRARTQHKHTHTCTHNNTCASPWTYR